MTSNSARVQVHFQLDRLRPGRVMDYRPLALSRFRIQAGHIGRHKVAAAYDRSPSPTLVIRFGQSVDDKVLQRQFFLTSV